MRMSGRPPVHLDGLSKSFYPEEAETLALSNINLSIKADEFVTFGAPSGCVKTTLLSILGQLDTLTAGQYIRENNPVEELTPLQRVKIRNQAIGFIFPSFSLSRDLTVYECVDLPLTYRGMPGRGRKKRVQGLSSAWYGAPDRVTIGASCPVVSTTVSRPPEGSWASR